MAELKRRRVFRALVGWGVVSFTVLQVVEPLMHALDLAEWTLKAVVAALALGFPVTTGLAWAFDLKATGIVRTAPAEPQTDRPRPSAAQRVRLALLLVGIGAVAAAPGVVYFFLWHPPAERREQPPGERVPVAVADFENDTGEPELDALSGLLITSLEQSRRLEVLTRSRMVDILRQMGHAAIPRIDESLGREVGKQAGVRALVLAAIHRFDQLYTIELKALDPATSSYLFTLKEDGKGKASVPAMIDRLSERTRERLRERPAEVESSRLKVAEAITPSLEAYQHYFRGKDASENRGDYGEGVREFQRAAAIDPTFGLAQMEIAYLGVWTDLDPAVRSAALDAALRQVDRMPKKERSLVLAWKAHMDGRDEEADAIYVRAAEEFPREKEIQYNAGDLRFHDFISARGSGRDLADVLPFFERAVALDPRENEAQNHLLAGLSMLGRNAEMLERAQAWVKAAPSAVAYDGLGRALMLAGRSEEALQAFRRAVDMGISPMYLGNYGHALQLAGREAEAESFLRGAAHEAWPSARLGVLAALVDVLLVQGRYREALRVADTMPEEVALADRSGAPARIRTAIFAHTGDAGRAWAAARPLFESRSGVDLVPAYLAYAGDLAHAEEAAALLAPDARQRSFHRAVAAWRSGRPDEAAALLQEIGRSKYVTERLLAASLLGELEAERGRDARAIDELERYRQAPVPGFPTLTLNRALRLPQALLLLARAYERTGDRARARERIGELLARWKRADPDLSLLREARALQARLQAPASASP